jgi:hypothetical protein
MSANLQRAEQLWRAFGLAIGGSHEARDQLDVGVTKSFASCSRMGDGAETGGADEVSVLGGRSSAGTLEMERGGPTNQPAGHVRAPLTQSEGDLLTIAQFSQRAPVSGLRSDHTHTRQPGNRRCAPVGDDERVGG